MPAQCKSRGTVATTRMRKVECAECGYTVRVSRRWIAQGLPVCPCGLQMDSVDQREDDLALEDWRRRDYEAATREARAGHGGEELTHCEWCGGIVAHRDSQCAQCGHKPDIRIGHRQGGNRRKPMTPAEALAAGHAASLRSAPAGVS